MKKHSKKFISMALTCIVAVSLGLAAYAQSVVPYDLHPNTIRADISYDSQTYSVACSMASGTKSVTVSATLYQKGLIFYSEVDSLSGSYTTRSFTCEKSYPLERGKTYKVAYTVTVTYTDGTSETIKNEFVKTA